MVIISKKIGQIIIRRTEDDDCKEILDFHNNYFTFSQPTYLKNTLESHSGLSIVGYQNKKVEGHILLFPLTSRRNIGAENAALITGIWCKNEELTHLLIKEAIMCAWESGFDAIFCLENNKNLLRHGFELIENNFFAIDTSEYATYGMELSWNGFQLIPDDLTIPKAFLPPIDKLDHFSKN